MKIKAGGQLEQFGKPGHKLEEIRIYQEETNSRMFYLMLSSNRPDKAMQAESLSYLTVDEMLDLKNEINQALSTLLI